MRPERDTRPPTLRATTSDVSIHRTCNICTKRRAARAARRLVQMLHVRWIETSEVVARSVGGRVSRSGRTFSGWSCRTGSGRERGFARFEIGRHVGRARRRVARRAAFVGVRENAMRRYSESTAYVEHARCQNCMQRKLVCKNVKVGVLNAM